MGNVKSYLLDEIIKDKNLWNDFTNEVFNYAIRVI